MMAKYIVHKIHVSDGITIPSCLKSSRYESVLTEIF